MGLWLMSSVCRKCRSFMVDGSSFRSFLLAFNVSKCCSDPIDAGRALSLLPLRSKLTRFFSLSKAWLRRQMHGSPTFSQIMLVQMRSGEEGRLSSCSAYLATLHMFLRARQCA